MVTTSAQRQREAQLLSQMREGVEVLRIIRQSISDPEKGAEVDAMLLEATANCELAARRQEIWARRAMLRSLSRRLTAEEQRESDRQDALVEASSESEGE